MTNPETTYIPHTHEHPEQVWTPDQARPTKTLCQKLRNLDRALSLHVDLWGSTVAGKAKITPLQTGEWSWWADYRYKRSMWPQRLGHTERQTKPWTETEWLPDGSPGLDSPRPDYTFCLGFCETTLPELERKSTLFLCWFAVVFIFLIYKHQSPVLQAGGYMAPTVKARKPECQGTMSMCIEVSKEGFDIFSQVLNHS